MTLRREVLSIFAAERAIETDEFLKQLRQNINDLSTHSKSEIVQSWCPSGAIITRDTLAAGQGSKTPPHISVLGEATAINDAITGVATLGSLARRAGSHLVRLNRRKRNAELVGTNIFIGHGRSPVWKDLRDFIRDRLKLPWDEFNRVPTAGVPNTVRLTEMLNDAAIALLV